MTANPSPVRSDQTPTATQRVVVFGASGFTGELVTHALMARGIQPVLAGRRRAALEELSARTGGGPVLVADSDRPESVRDLLEPGDILATTVGPFGRHGGPAVEAAVAAGAHYLDPAGEGGFVRRVLHEYGPRAAAAGCALLPAFGFESVPGNLAAALALRAAGPDATGVEVMYVCDPRVSSGGTRASAAGVALEPSFAWRAGALADQRVAARTRSFGFPAGRVLGISIPSSEHLTLPVTFPGLLNVEVYLGGFGPLVHPLRALAAVQSRIAGVAPLRRWVTAANGLLFRPSSGGPDTSRRAATTTYVTARALDRQGREITGVTFAGPDPYQLTADLFGWAVQRIRAGGLRAAGGLGPVAAFGLDDLAAAAPALGLRRVDPRATARRTARRVS